MTSDLLTKLLTVAFACLVLGIFAHLVFNFLKQLFSELSPVFTKLVILFALGAGVFVYFNPSSLDGLFEKDAENTERTSDTFFTTY